MNDKNNLASSSPHEMEDFLQRLQASQEEQQLDQQMHDSSLDGFADFTGMDEDDAQSLFSFADTSETAGENDGSDTPALTSASSTTQNASPASGPSNAAPAPVLTRVALRNERRRKNIRRVIGIIVAIALVIVLGWAGVKVYRKVRSIQAANQQAQLEAQKAKRVTDYPGPGEGSVEFTVEKGQGSGEIGENLVKQGIVASVAAFDAAVVNADAAQKLQPGTFQLKYKMASKDVVAILVDPTKAEGMINVTASTRVSAVISAASQLMNLPQSDFQALLDSHGDGILPPEAKGSFEGWLQPDTYNPKDYSSAHDLFADMVKKRIAFLDENKVPTGDERENILIRASIIGGEVNREEYYGQVSRVIENRLKKNMPLGMDSTVAYGFGVDPHGLTQAMLQDESNPYNSRIQKGLPPTPINQPNLAMIDAAMNPTPGDWLYFVTVNLSTGETKFTADYSEFEKYSQEYQQWEANN